MKLTILAAWVDALRQLGKKRAVEGAAGEVRRQLLGIDAGQVRFETARDHLLGERSGIAPPERKQRRDARARELRLAIGTDILQEQIAEGHGLDTARRLLRHERAHARLVGLVGARPRDLYDMQRQPGGSGLRFQQRAPHCMHGDAIEGGIDGGE